jgi:hypothetical protein
MPELVFTIISRGHAVDRATNALTVFSTVESVSGPSFPFIIPELSVCTLWRMTAGEEGQAFVQRVSIVDPSFDVVVAMDSPFTFDALRRRVTASVRNVPFRGPGCYRVVTQVRPAAVESWSDPLAGYPIECTLAPARTTGEGQSGASGAGPGVGQ